MFVINSFSKPWAMTGWRIGWLVHPAQLRRDVDDVGREQHGRDHLRAMGRAGGTIAARRRVPRRNAARAASKGRDVVHKFLATPKPHPLDRTRRRVLRLPPCRGHEGQFGVAQRISCATRAWASRPARPSRRRTIARDEFLSCASASPRMPARVETGSRSAWEKQSRPDR